MTEPAPSRPVIVGLTVAALVHTLRYLPHFSDDAFISLRYAQRLADGLGLTWNDGEWVEGFSNLLWVLSIALLDLGGVAGIDAARLLGCVGLVLCVGAVARVSALNTGWVVLCGGLCAWAVGGLEHALVAGVAAWSALLLREGRGVALAPVLALLRVDGIVLVLGLGLGAGRQGIRFVIAGLIAVAVQIALRLWWFADWLPNTARAKLAFTPNRLVYGARYVLEAAVAHAPLVVLAVVAVALVRKRSPALVACGVWCAYLVVVGGDHFNGYRLFVQIVPLLALVVAEAPLPRWVVPVGLVLYCGQLFAEPVVAQSRPGWALQTQALGEALKRGFGDQRPLLATDAAGALPYSTGFPTLDMLGLNDRHLATHRPADMGSGPLHHELGDGAYVLQRQPDLIAFCSGLGAHEPCFRGGKELVQLDGFAGYRPIVVEEGGLRGHYWLQQDGPFGMARAGDALEIPALLLSSDLPIDAYLDQGFAASELLPPKAGRDGFYVDVAKRQRVVTNVVLPQGRWRVATQGFSSPTIWHSGGPIRLEAVAQEARVLRSLTWLADPPNPGGGHR